MAMDTHQLDGHLHVEGAPVDHAEWSAEPRDEGFDAAAMERAMIAARREAYASLATLDAA